MHQVPQQYDSLRTRRFAFFSAARAGSACAAIFLSLIALPLLMAGLLPSNASAAENNTPIWSAGKLQVFAIQDRPGEMSQDLFSGPANAEQRSRYFKDGKAPASVNVFLIRIGGKNILVDTGLGTVAPGKSALIPVLNELGLAPESIDVVVLTHMHMDHLGGLLLHKKRAFPNASVMVSRQEIEYWTGLGKQNPDNANAQLVNTVIDVYGKDVLPPFDFDTEILPGVTALEAAGHTPGHTALRMEADGKKLMIIGDLVHAAALQFPLPEECASYDIDPVAAVASRIKILNLAAAESIPVAGMHIPFPGYGNIEKQGNGFTFTPIGEKN